MTIRAASVGDAERKIVVKVCVRSGIMGDGTIDGRGGATRLGGNETWWDLAHEAKVTDKSQSVPWLIMVRNSTNFTLYRITLRNSPGFHVSVNTTDGFTAWGVRIMTPKTARNTDGIDPGSSRNVTITHCDIHTGDDDVAVKSGNAGPASNISVLHNHFYTGHGMSIGSGTDGGVDHMLVDDLTIDGADNGIRIKSDRSRGGLVHHITYRNVCIRNVPNPIVLTPVYTTFPGNRLPVYRDIRLENVHALTPGAYTFLGLDRLFDPVGHRDRANMSAFANEIDDVPMLFTLLQVREIQISEFAASKSAANQHREHCTVPLSFQGVRVGRLPETACFLGCEPVCEPHAQLYGALNPSDPRREFRAK